MTDFKNVIFSKKDKKDLDRVKRDLIQVVSSEMQMMSENMSESTHQTVCT